MKFTPRTIASRTMLAAALAVGAGLAVPAQHATAQQISVAASPSFGGMGGGSLTAPLGKSDVEQMSKLLKFTEDQKGAAGLFLDAYLAEHAKRAEPLKAAQDAAQATFREDRDFSVFGELAPKQEAFAKESAVKEKELLENVKGLLTKEQTAQWPTWERAHRRAKSMNRGMLAGERADLIQIVERLKFSDAANTALTPTLDAYGMELDRVIIARDEAQNTAAEDGKSMREQFTKGGGPGSPEFMEMMKKADELMKKSREASIPVRDVNRKYAKQIETTLAGISADEAKRFSTEFRKISYPDIYRERYADRALAAAAAMEGLEKSQLEGIAAIKEQYLRERAPLEQAAEKAADDAEANFSLTGMMGGGGGGIMRMMGGDEATKEARKARRELDTSVIDKLKAILTTEQVAKLPDRAADTASDAPFVLPGGGGAPGVRVITR
jgi:hypothetical protein